MGIKRIITLLGALIAACGLSVGTGSAVASAHEPGTNGCTLSPDESYVPVYYNFHRSCDRHDLCYINKPYGNTSAGRYQCDLDFRASMRGWCAGYYSRWWQAPLRSTCYGVADTYYTAVRTFGGAFF